MQFTVAVHQLMQFTVAIHQLMQFTVAIHQLVQFTVAIHQLMQFTVAVQFDVLSVLYSCLEIREYARGDPSRGLRDTPLSAKVGTNFADKRRSHTD
jgi:hypothetical protein